MSELLSHTIVALVHDRPGVLNRVTSMFRRRGFNITSLAVGNSETLGLSRMTFVVHADEATVEQVTKQLGKLVDMVQVSDISGENTVGRELSMIRVHCAPETRNEIIQLVEIFRANIVDVSANSLIIEVTGDVEKVDSFLRLMKPFGLQEVIRSGRLAMVRGITTEDGGGFMRERAGGYTP